MPNIVSRVIVLFVLVTSSVFASGICQCPPSIFGNINGNSIPSGTFTITALVSGGYTIDGRLIDPAFQFSLHSSTDPDPAVGFDMDISGDPTVQLTILQPYLGGPFPAFVTNGFGSLTDGNADGIATLTNSFIRTTVTGPGIVGSIVSQIDLNCVATGPPGFQNIPCNPGQVFPFLQGPGAPDGLMRVDIQFTLSDFDGAFVRGTSILADAAAIPEPATDSFFVVGFLAFGGFAIRRKRRSHS